MIPAIIVAFFPAFGFSLLDAIAAYMVNVVGMSIFQVMVCRNTMASAVLIPYLYWSQTPHAPIGPPGSRLLLWLRGVNMTIALLFVYTALRYLTLSEFWMVNSCTPFPTAILCWFILSERFTRTQGVCCVLSIIGVLLITIPMASGMTGATAGGTMDEGDHIPSGPLSKVIGLCFAFPSIVIIGCEIVIMRKLGDSVGHIQVLAAMAAAPAVITALIMIIGQIPFVWPRTTLEWVMLVGTVPCGWFAQFTMTYAGQRLSGMTVIMTTYTGLVHSTAIQWLIYGNHPNTITTVGIVMIIITGIIAAVYGQEEAKDVSAGSDRETEMQARDGAEDEEAGPSIPLLRGTDA